MYNYLIDMNSRRTIAVLVVCIILIGAAFYFSVLKKQTAPQRPAFDPAKQFVPKGAESRDVDQSLAAFGFPKHLPFFDKNNVVQSLSFGTGVSHRATSSPSRQIPETYVGYRIVGQSTTAVREAYRNYFQDIKWKEAGGTNKNPMLIIFFSPDGRRQASIQLIELPSSADSQQKTVVAAFSMLTFPPINPSINPRSIKQ